jgi:sec-independent protein translocase protein TatB
MFDIGFWELVLVGVVSLIVFGPERLPRAAREAALWVKRARAMVASVKEEIDQELQLQDLKRSLLEEKRMIESQATSSSSKKAESAHLLESSGDSADTAGKPSFSERPDGET